jgi:predicted AAA+ superfamily ATPase
LDLEELGRALAQRTDVNPLESTSYFGELFEQWFISEVFRTIKYLGKKIQMNFYLEHDSHEVDAVLTWPKQAPIFIEIKSTKETNEAQTKGLLKVAEIHKGSLLFFVSQDIHQRNLGSVVCLNWRTFLEKLNENDLG